ncbi:hypothetical protein F7734_50300 [Scytonema sp. UIC 10036]|uniref:hypothetical protein n=1 Tax=Scytonema sp. UIC 10036 TaxID=2304196 RepID=UPI0012DAC4E7|nr:hypothetical protein [Scytonema sp. UIC 10036]MUH00036.1 hypothetical protein [Scytonema sp. UIC 10036]
MHLNQISALPVALFISVTTVEMHVPIASAEEVKPFDSPLLISQRYRERRTIRAVSGPDDQGRWRFNKPSGVSSDEMRAQGCVDVGSNNAQRWRCPRDTIRLEIYSGDYDDRYNDRYDRDRYDDRYDRGGSYTQRLRAVSGPDDQGRWRFYKPNDVSDDAMRAQGCVNVGTQIPWRCPSDRIRVEVFDRESGGRYDDRYDRRPYERRVLRAVSGPDDQGRWRFYKPNNVSDDAMRAEGCVYVGARNAQPWRCPRERIRVEVGL